MKITTFGGDERLVAAAVNLSQAGHTVSTVAIDDETLAKYGALDLRANYEKLSGAILFPLPFTTDGTNVNCPFSNNKYEISDVLRQTDKNSTIFCGMISKFHKKLAEEYGLSVIDYYENEAFQILNSVPTAEGAIEVFMKHKKITVFSSKCIVTGFGKVGKCLASRLAALGARVTVALRSAKDAAVASSLGFETVNIDNYIKNPVYSDCIFNTVPCNLFDDEFVSLLPDETLYIELASTPHGLNKKTAELLGQRYIAAPSLPGKYAPFTAGKIIAETVCKYI